MELTLIELRAEQREMCINFDLRATPSFADLKKKKKKGRRDIQTDLMFRLIGMLGWVPNLCNVQRERERF